MPGHGSTYAMGSTLEFLATYARRLVRLMPILGDIKILRQWAGPYDQSPDGNPILGAAPEHPDFFLACGFVGHGFMMAPIVGKLYAEWLTGGARARDLRPLPARRGSRDGGAPRTRRKTSTSGECYTRWRDRHSRNTRSGSSAPATWPRR